MVTITESFFEEGILYRFVDSLEAAQIKHLLLKNEFKKLVVECATIGRLVGNVVSSYRCVTAIAALYWSRRGAMLDLGNCCTQICCCSFCLSGKASRQGLPRGGSAT